MPIALTLFAVLTVLGAWAGWRRSPLYSGRITLKLVAIFLLMLAAILALTVAITSGFISRSPVAQVALGAIAAVVIGTGATGLIIRATDSHLAQLPPALRVSTVERHKVQRWIWRTLVYLLMSAAAALAWPQWSWLPGVPGLLILLGCGPMLTGFYMRARRLDLGTTAVMAAPWAHWQYTADEWERWARQQRDWELATNPPFVWKRDTGKWVKFLLFVTALFALGALFAGGSSQEKIAITAGLTGFVVLLMLTVILIGHGAAERRYRRLLAAPRDTYFGAEGVFCNGEFTLWTLSGAYLIEATALHDLPARVVLVFQTFNGSTSAEVTKRVAIPPGREADLPVLQEKLRATSRTARLKLA